MSLSDTKRATRQKKQKKSSEMDDDHWIKFGEGKEMGILTVIQDCRDTAALDSFE